MRRFLSGIAMLLSLAGGLPAAAQQYPARPIQFVIPFATGGPTDTAIRVIQPQLAANLGVPVVLVNKPGGGGAVGMDGVAKARPDGDTLAATVRSTVTILPATQPDVTYRIADFAVVGSYAIDSGVILVKAGAPWKTLEEFVDHARKNPGKVTDLARVAVQGGGAQPPGRSSSRADTRASSWARFFTWVVRRETITE